MSKEPMDLSSEDAEYTPELGELLVAYRYMVADLMMDPDSKPHDPALQAEADAEFERAIERVRREAQADVLDPIGRLKAAEAKLDAVSLMIDTLHATGAIDQDIADELYGAMDGGGQE